MSSAGELPDYTSEEEGAQAQAIAASWLFVDELRDIRIARRTTQGEIARLMRTNQPAIAKMEAHNHDPRFSTVLRYMAALGLDPMELVERLEVAREGTESTDSTTERTDPTVEGPSESLPMSGSLATTEVDTPSVSSGKAAATPLRHSEQIHRVLVARVPETTGRTLPEWFRTLEEGPSFARFDDRVNWLRDEFGITLDHATAIVHEHNLVRAHRSFE